jgi:hypothetical protein
MGRHVGAGDDQLPELFTSKYLMNVISSPFFDCLTKRAEEKFLPEAKQVALAVP